MKSLVQKISLNQQDLNVEPVSPGLWELCITAGQIYMFTSDNAAENKIFSSGRSQFFKKKRVLGLLQNWRIVHILSPAWRQISSPPGDVSPHYLSSFHSYLLQLGTMSSSSIPLVSTILCAKEPSFPNSQNYTWLFGGKKIWKQIQIHFTTTYPMKTAKSCQ